MLSRAAVFCWNICILDITLQKTAFNFIVMTLGSHQEACSLYAVGSLMVQLVEPLRYKAEGQGGGVQFPMGSLGFLYILIQSHCGPGVYLAFNRNENQGA